MESHLYNAFNRRDLGGHQDNFKIMVIVAVKPFRVLDPSIFLIGLTILLVSLEPLKSKCLKGW